MKLWSACLSVGLLVAGCAGQGARPPATEVTRIPETGDWFCQLSPSGRGWQCVQDPILAEHPEPRRLPTPDRPTTPEPAALPVPDRDAPGAEPADATAAPQPARPGGRWEAAATDAETNPPVAEQQTPGSLAVETPESLAVETPESLAVDASPAPLRPQAPPPEDPDPDARSAAPAAGDGGIPASAPDGAPAYARLAYQPAQAVPLSDLPPDFYALQVLAMNTRPQIESFVERHGMSGVSAARVERDGRIYYVLLLGIYESLDLARQAAAALPAPFDAAQPWIRPLGSLQAAMKRADRLTASTGG